MTLELNKFYIFNQFFDTMEKIAEKSDFELVNYPNWGVITGWPSAPFNVVGLTELNDQYIANLIRKNILFLCFVLNADDNEATITQFMNQHHLIKVDNIIAHTYENLQSWHYQGNAHINIKKVDTLNDLECFDNIASISFNTPPHYVYKFLKPHLVSKKFYFYVAYDNDIPCGCGMLSINDDQAGLY